MRVKRSVMVLWAFLARDALMAFSYRLSFAMQWMSLVLGILSMYFVSLMIGDNPMFDRYGGYLPFAVIGAATSTFMLTGFNSFSTAIRSEQMMGTLESVLMTPVRLALVMIGSSLWSFVWTMINSTVTIAAATLLFGIELKGNILVAMLLLLLTTATFSCLGIVSAGFTMVFKRGDPLRFLVGTLTYLVGGVLFPIEILPGWLQRVSALMPITYGLRGVRQILLTGGEFTDVIPAVLFLLAFIAMALPISLLLFAKAVNVARREGSLLHY